MARHSCFHLGNLRLFLVRQMKYIYIKLCINIFLQTTHTNNAYNKFPYGLAVRIPGFHPGGPGSTPGMGKRFPFLTISLYTET